ncbi:MAG: cellulase family glycosylhydrolase [Chloroflexota bacterium]
MGGSNFSINWPSDSRPASVITPFNATTGAVAIAAPAGAKIKAGVAGKVTSASGSVVQIASGVFTVAYSNLKNLAVTAGQDVAADALIGESAGPDSIAVTVYQAVDPTPMLVQPSAAPAGTSTGTGTTPTPTTGTKLYVVPTTSGVRIRETPVDGKPVSQAGTLDILEVIEDATAAKAKIGADGQWINIKKLDGTVGYSSAQFLQLYNGPIPVPAPTPSVPADVKDLLGMNLDMHNPLGHPSPDRLKGVGWIRVKFNVSFDPEKQGNAQYGNTDIDKAFSRMKPFLKQYTDTGIQVLMVFTHQLYGEGAGYNWPQMDTGRWNEFIPKYADFAKRTAKLFAGTGLVHAYQIWNEQDTPPAIARAAVPIPAKDYGNMLTQTIRAIRSVDSTTPIVTGGHTTGPDAGGAYARATLAAMPSDVRPDGISSHPYGRGVKGHKFSNFGALDEEIRKYSAILPGKPVWFTEWGVLDRQGDTGIAGDVGDYAAGFLNVIKSQFSGQVAAAMWYAWADGMDNGYGFVDSGDKPKTALLGKVIK